MEIFIYKEDLMSRYQRRRIHRHSKELASNGGWMKQSRGDGWDNYGLFGLKRCKLCKLASDNETDVCTLCQQNEKASRGQ